ncbi:hypothetical protein ABZY93_21310 [Streptomyces smyrnaeus]|uniref:GNAT family N-acetyltransferase n=1 Tax=Streptomyces smyrnaeus TaxID=1387713 RepID=UPI0033BBCD89
MRPGIRRVWVAPHARKGGLGGLLVATAECSALEMGATTVRLDTRGDLVEARRMSSPGRLMSCPCAVSGGCGLVVACRAVPRAPEGAAPTPGTQAPRGKPYPPRITSCHAVASAVETSVAEGGSAASRPARPCR